jgi:hypothetical protein
LRPHLEFVELVRETALVQAGAPVTHVYLPQSAVPAIVVRLPEGQSVEIALVGRDSIFSAAAAFDDAISSTNAIIRLPGTASRIRSGGGRSQRQPSRAARTTRTESDRRGPAIRRV